MKRCIPVVLLSLLVVFAAQAGATNLIQNGDFTSGFDHWTLGTTSNGTAGQGFPAVTGCMFHIGYLCWTGQVGQVNSSDQFEGATLSQTFLSAAGSATISMWYSLQRFPRTRNRGRLVPDVLDGSLVAQQNGVSAVSRWVLRYFDGDRFSRPMVSIPSVVEGPAVSGCHPERSRGTCSFRAASRA